MKKRINLRLILIAGIAVIVTMVCMTGIYYKLFQGQVRKDLQINARLLSGTGLFDDPDNTNVSLSEYYEVGEDLRVTWIAKDGTVLFDNDLDISQLPNHKNRPEVKKALFQGEGESVRRSDTMQMDNYYYALRLILILIVSICIVLAHFLTKQLLHPIERLAENMEDTIEEPVYKELVPFVNTIRKQHENILMAAKVRQDFTANVSHELKTPLTAISGYAELIENHMVDPEQETRFALEIQQNATRLLSLINDIIRLSELDSGEDNLLCFEQVDLDEVAGTCVKNLQMNAQKRNVTLYYEGVSCMLRADRGMISELVENLCQNAIRYNNEGGEVHVRVYFEKGQPMLSVSMVSGFQKTSRNVFLSGFTVLIKADPNRPVVRDWDLLSSSILWNCMMRYFIWKVSREKEQRSQ